MKLNEQRTLLYAGWLYDERGYYRPGQTRTRVSQREATQIQAIRERAMLLVYGNEQENSLAL